MNDVSENLDAAGKGQDQYFGRMNDPIGSAFVHGLCGDEMEFYLDIFGDIVREVKYYTEGCEHTRLCGSTAARLATGKSIMDVLAISPREVIEAVGPLPRDGQHCAILAVSALHRAIADYLLQS
jgi:nitrogen fixation NifU-like protein